RHRRAVAASPWRRRAGGRARMSAETWVREFAGKRVVITGAAGTLGRWLVRAFATAGAALALSDRNEAGLTALAAENAIARAGGFTHATELRDDASLAAFVALVRTRWGAPDIVVNNAGVFPTGLLSETTNAEWDRIFAIDLRAVFVLTRDLAGLMVEA